MTIEPNAHAQEVVFEYTPCFPEILEQLQTCVVISTFQAAKVIVLAARCGMLQIAFHDFDRPMGLAVHENQLAVGCRESVELFEHEAASRAMPQATGHDACIEPRPAGSGGAQPLPDGCGSAAPFGTDSQSAKKGALSK